MSMRAAFAAGLAFGIGLALGLQIFNEVMGWIWMGAM